MLKYKFNPFDAFTEDDEPPANIDQEIMRDDYVIGKEGVNYVAIPNPRSSYPRYSNASMSIVLQACIDELVNGGKIFIKAGLYDDMGQVSITHNNIIIEGQSKYVTTLKFAAADDAGHVGMYGLLDVNNYDGFELRNIGLDGNGLNQTKVDNGASVTAICMGVYAQFTNNTVIDNCYIHDFTQACIQTHGDVDLLINECHLKNGFWNCVTIGWACSNNQVINCLVEGPDCGDVGIALYGTFNCIIGCIVRTITGTHGSGNTKCGISVEDMGGTPTTDHFISGNRIYGTGMTSGISAPGAGTAATERLFIQNNHIYDADFGIYLAGNNAVINGNFINEAEEMAIHIQGGESNIIQDNTLLCIASKYAIVLSASGSDYSHYNLVLNNYLKMASGTYVYCFAINSGCNDNIVSDNIVFGASGEQVNIADAGTRTILKNNYGQSGLRWQPETGTPSVNYTATATGATTGQIKPGSQYAYISSADVNYICRLPFAQDILVGTTIRGRCGSTGFELRVESTQEATVSINNVSGAGVEAAIPALHYFEIVLVTTSRWILKCYSSLGAYVTIIPNV